MTSLMSSSSSSLSHIPIYSMITYIIKVYTLIMIDDNDNDTMIDNNDNDTMIDDNDTMIDDNDNDNDTSIIITNFYV